MATKRQEAVEEEPEEDLEPEEEPEERETPEQQSGATIDTVPWRDAMEVAGLIEDIDPGDGLSSPEYVNPR